MEQFEALGDASVYRLRRELPRRCIGGHTGQRPTRSCREDIGRPHRPEVAHEVGETPVTDIDPVEIDDRHDEAGIGQELGQRRRLDTRMNVRARPTHALVSCSHCGPKRRERVAPGERSNCERVGLQCKPRGEQRSRQIAGSVQDPYAHAQLVGARLDLHQLLGLDHVDVRSLLAQAVAPPRIGAADQQRSRKRPLDERQPLHHVLKGALVQEQFRAATKRALSAQRTGFLVEQVSRHRALVRRQASGDKDGVRVGDLVRAGLRQLLDFALPPRCAGCGAIVDEVHSFCASCWTEVEFLGDSGCSTCGLPLQATEAEECGACLAMPPRIQRTRSAVAYDELSRSIAIRLKYGRKVALARTMARYMAPLVQSDENAILVPVPLHRSRLWQRGFNQSALVAAEIAQRTGLRSNPRLLRRVKRTPALKGMSRSQRERTVAGAFRVDPSAELAGRTVVLVDDVLTTGSTAEACAKALKRAGAQRVELVSWARVVRPMQLS